eukprot:CAMPEP_0118958268 /NCGR_PEP_ID=MMETSP1169-20130426/62537_1 /TAXON_ID=36882 /ORGANISM="Pyramimonas obovata, Strain CCMP722" /LENGTH=94 /DNA_ID=CAMNT_0006906383 /DNA_START=1320 /DNA_END=1604 /DNA_ORIENTATION=+
MKALKASNAAIGRLNVAISSMIAKKRDPRVRFVNQKLTPLPRYMSRDGVHHSPEGEAVLADSWAVALTPALAHEVLVRKHANNSTSHSGATTLA